MRRHGVGRCKGGGADNKKITFIFQNKLFLLLTGYLEFHFRSQGKSGKSHGIPSWKKSGNPVFENNECELGVEFVFVYMPVSTCCRRELNSSFVYVPTCTCWRREFHSSFVYMPTSKFDYF